MAQKVLLLFRIDWLYFLFLVILISIGIIMIFSTSNVEGLRSFGDPFHYIKRQMLFLVLGTGLFLIGAITPPHRYKEYALPGLLISTLLLMLPFFPKIGVNTLGASRWINIGIMQFQPTEIAKFFIAVFLATSLQNKYSVMPYFTKGLLPILLIILLPVLVLAKQPDLGNIIVIMAVTFSLFFLSRAKLLHILSFFGVGLLGFVASVLTHPYQLQRIVTFLNPEKDPQGTGYNVLQSFMAVGSGGLQGVGIGQSKLKFSYLPFQFSDFIFSVVCEEGGLILASVVLGLFAAILIRGLMVGRRTHDLYLFYLSAALSMFITYQALVNIGVTIGLLPAKGIPLTFISFGGSNLICSMFFAGVVVSISRYAKSARPKADPHPVRSVS